MKNNLTKDIINYAKRYNLKIKIFESIFYVDSIFDEWFIEKESNNYYTINHCNKMNSKGNKTKGKFHKHNHEFFSIFSAIRYIHEHDMFDISNKTV